MTLGEKITKLRKENNHTQEQLAEILGVSRQSVSKWESDSAYPETDKLVALGELYDCSMDYLLKEDVESERSTAPKTFNLQSFYFEKKSAKMVKGVPLWHVNIGVGRTAKGIFAVGLCAKGVFSIGLFSQGVVSCGLFSLGVLSFGCFALGLLAMGAIALGLVSAGAVSVGVIAFGAMCVGFLSVGALSVGQFSFGAMSIGNYLAVGDHAQAAIAIGKSEAIGSLYSAPSITAEGRQEIFTLLDSTVPAFFGWLKEIAKLFV